MLNKNKTIEHTINNTVNNMAPIDILIIKFLCLPISILLYLSTKNKTNPAKPIGPKNIVASMHKNANGASRSLNSCNNIISPFPSV